jgi:hypothetical protein
MEADDEYSKGISCLPHCAAPCFLMLYNQMGGTAPITKGYGHYLAKGIDVTGPRDILLNPTDIFSIQDAEIISHITFENLSGKHKVKWDWYAPSGDLYYSTGNHPLEASSGTYIEEGSAWHKISVSGEKAQEYPGDWKVDIYLDNQLLASRAFELKPVLAKRKSYAVIVGISQYRYTEQSGLTNLPFAGDDAKDFRDSLLALGWDFDHIRCLTNQEATLRDIMISRSRGSGEGLFCLL